MRSNGLHRNPMNQRKSGKTRERRGHHNQLRKRLEREGRSCAIIWRETCQGRRSVEGAQRNPVPFQGGVLMKMRLGWVLVLILGLAPTTWSQTAGGNVYGKVADEQGAVLP